MAIRSLSMAVLLLFASSIAAQMRCGNKLVGPGASLFEVREQCGLPVFENQRIDYRYPGFFVHLDEWVYEQGTTRFRRALLFENGELRRIELLAKPRQ